MQRSFHLYIRRHVNDWFTVSILTHPQYAVFGPDLDKLKQELSEVMAQEMATDVLNIWDETFFEGLSQRVLSIELRAVQHERLIRVPMRFTLLQYKVGDTDRYEVMLPRLGRRFSIHGEENIMEWAEEIVRGFFHLSDVEKLLLYQYERGARLEKLNVVYHGARRYKKVQRARREQLSDIFGRASPLTEVGVELIEEAREGRLGRAHHRGDLIEQLGAILSGSQDRSALLVGPSGVGKTAIVHELAHRIAQNKAPHRLQGVPMWHITGGRIIAGMKYLGQWQERLQNVVEEIRGERGILYVDSLLELMMTGSSRTGLNVASFLLPYVRSGEVVVIAEATPDALVVAEQISATFVQALRRLPVPSFSTERAYEILELRSRQYAKTHKVVYSQASLSRALDVLARFGDAESLPGSGLALIEQMARLVSPDRRKAGKRPTLEAADAVAAFARASGFPQTLIDPDAMLDVETVRAYFAERIIGQPEAVELLTNLVTIVKASLNDPGKPLGSFLFMGPTGVGKTESALTLAEYLFGDRDRLLRLDMSEYAYPGAASRLVGGGLGEGELTRKVREQPFCVLLFDEIEKADPEVFDILLQVLGEGRLTDGTGRTVHFTHTIAIMTSNLGARKKPPIRIQGADDNPFGDLRAHYIDAASRFFRPEFVNRIDFLVPFEDLTQDAVRQIARRMLESALSREGFERRGIEVRYDEPLLDLLMTHGFDPSYGARPMKRAVEQHVLIPLSRRLARRSATGEEAREIFDLYVRRDRVAVLSSKGPGREPAPTASGLSLDHDGLWRGYLSGVRLRLQEWEESAAIRRLIETDKAALPDQIEAMQRAVDTLEEVAREPSTLAKGDREALAARAETFDGELLVLEWALCLETLGGGDTRTLHIEPRSVHATGADLTAQLAAQLVAWGQSRGWTADHTRDSDRSTLTLRGPGAEAALHTLLGLHTLTTANAEEIDLLIFEGDADPEATVATIFEISQDPPTVWDPSTELEIPTGLDALSEHLDRLILARMCARL